MQLRLKSFGKSSCRIIEGFKTEEKNALKCNIVFGFKIDILKHEQQRR